MSAGLLWTERSRKIDLGTKVARAVRYYQRKYGQVPDLCFVHPGALVENPTLRFPGLEIRPYKKLRSNQMWLGVANRQGGSR